MHVFLADEEHSFALSTAVCLSVRRSLHASLASCSLDKYSLFIHSFLKSSDLHELECHHDNDRKCLC